MGIYEKCKDLTNRSISQQCKTTALLQVSKNDISTYPSILSIDFNDDWTCSHVYYISDIHLAHKVVKRFKEKATDEQIMRYIKKIAKDLVQKSLCQNTTDCDCYSPDIIVFGGDISSCFELSEVFYSEFVKQWNEIQRSSNTSFNDCYIYAVLGNHEFWGFERAVECFDAYRNLFNRLDICFLQNEITWFGKYRKPIDNTSSRYINNALIVGGVGFAGCNNTFNADTGIYKTALNRAQEITESTKWMEIYDSALELAKKTNSVLIVLTHNPLSDWKSDGTADIGCIYFSGHDHQNQLYHDENNNIHIFSNNQIGYHTLNIRFKEAYIYKRMNPFAGYRDGYHEITSCDYLRFCDYAKMNVRGSGLIDKQLKDNKTKFYVIKRCGYYGFFLISTKYSYICAGGRIKKIRKYTDIKQLDADFLDMVQQYIKVLTPYRNVQEQISNMVKSFGGEGTIHGCIIDIDFFDHILLNPSDGSITYYYSPMFGTVKTYSNLLSLLINHNNSLAAKYQEQLKLEDTGLFLQCKIDIVSEMLKIDIKNSVYSISNRINQLQRLFDKKILRDWNDALLLSDNLTRPNTSIPLNSLSKTSE